MSDKEKVSNKNPGDEVQSKLKDAFENDKFAVTCEIGPPKGTNTAEIFEIGEMLQGLVDGINVTDLQSSVMRLGSLVTCHLLTEMGHDPVFQMTTRDRNRLALQSDALSAYVMGVRNVLALTGDHVTVGDHPEAKAVYDLDSVSLLWTLKNLESGKDLSGGELDGKPSFFKGAVVNPGADTFEAYELQILKMKKKIEAGAQFFQTQAVFDAEIFEKFMDRMDKENIKTPIMIGVILLKSHKMANYMNKFVPGIYVPEPIVKRMEETDDKVSTCLEILVDLIEKVKPICQGVHIQALGWEKHVPKLIKDLDI